jgi:hypothetical protein
MLEAREVLLRRRLESAIADLQQARERLRNDEDEAPEAAGRLGEAVGRVQGETAEIADSFRGIREELANNAVLTEALEARIITQIAAPLAAVSEGELRQLAAGCRDREPVITLAARTDRCLERLQEILGRMIELESFNEVVESLRRIIETQESIRRQTLDQQRARARDILKGL